MVETTPKFGLPLLYTAQANKEIIHNEALMLLDATILPVIVAEQADPPADLTSGDSGKSWLVAANPTGVWENEEGRLAFWMGDSWRFVEAPERSRIFRSDLAVEFLKRSDGWFSPSTMADPSGGAVVDNEARQAITSILSFLRSTGAIPT